jgi:cephalosporin-C deacetylase
LTERNDLGNDSMAVYSVEFRSLDSARIQGWYIYPKNKKNLRAVIYTQGYTAENIFSTGYLQFTEYAQFLLNIRGHGSSTKDVNPGFPKFLEYGLENPHTYIFRGAYMDCVRSIDFLCSRPEIDSSRIGIWGTSMGGALALAASALDRRIKLCIFDLPFLSDFRNYFEIGSWPSYQIRNYATRNNRSMASVYQTLDYFDIKNLAPWVQCPVVMGVGLLDMTCPPAINFAAYNNVRVKNKVFYLYPDVGHYINAEHYGRVRLAFLNRL